MNPTNYYSPLDFEYPLVDEHVDEVKVDDHVDEVKVEAYVKELVEQTARNVTFYESPNEMEEGKKNKREWVILGSIDVLFQTIPIMMSSTSEHALYKGAMFMSKEELKMSLGLLALKEKLEYK